MPSIARTSRALNSVRVGAKARSCQYIWPCFDASMSVVLGDKFSVACTVAGIGTILLIITDTALEIQSFIAGWKQKD